jgi:nitrogen fixation protein FixH
MLPFNEGAAPPREVTGRMVLIWLVGFFAVVFAVNGVMAVAAISTFSGLDSDSPYQAGLAFDAEIADARAQRALHWQVQATVVKTDAGATRIDISARDPDGVPLPGLAATASLVHPTDRRRDRDLALTEDTPGHFRGVTGPAVGQWDVVIDLSRDGTRLFQSKNRVTLH